MRWTDILEKVAKDSNKIARKVAGDKYWCVLGGESEEFKTIALYYAISFLVLI